jgi:hypothetical protein
MLNDLKKLKVKDWPYLAEERSAWYELVQRNKTHKVLCQQQQNKILVVDWEALAFTQREGFGRGRYRAAVK